jgi:hypothetical protein
MSVSRAKQRYHHCEAKPSKLPETSQTAKK